MEKNVAIIGSGRLAKAIVSGLLRSGDFTANDIKVFVRAGCTSDLTFFQRIRIPVYIDVGKVENAKYVILAVAPEGIGQVLFRLRSVRFKFAAEIISFVSGLTTSDIKKALFVNYMTIIVATTNTNASYNKAITCATKQSKIFTCLGSFIKEDEEGIIHSVVTVGSMSAVHYTALILLYYKSYGLSLYDWLVSINKVLVEKNQNEDNVLVLKYIKTLSLVLNDFGYLEAKTTDRVYITLLSCIQTLLLIPGYITITAFFSLRMSVITNGGCTGKGIGEIKDVSHLTDKNHLANRVFAPMILNAEKFGEKIEKSISLQKQKFMA